MILQAPKTRARVPLGSEVMPGGCSAPEGAATSRRIGAARLGSAAPKFGGAWRASPGLVPAPAGVGVSVGARGARGRAAAGE